MSLDSTASAYKSNRFHSVFFLASLTCSELIPETSTREGSTIPSPVITGADTHEVKNNNTIVKYIF
ncbi:MAG: hypothetical protein L6Q54_01480 [Leptospiraceae bacterium]|nr:hypothetical protein [Leptospiraceae bacterium]MCK6379911.1 hypothetical protein [Leptospiraceae bacterium]